MNNKEKADRKTPLYEKHINLGGKMTSFGGYLLPVQYNARIVKEHMAVRKSAGIFDVSHMGEIIISGKHSLEFLQKLFTNDFSKMKKNQVKYTLMCYDDGGVIDDLLIYKLTDSSDENDKYMLVVNASNRNKDYEWILDHRTDGVEISDISDETALIALQGPKAGIIVKSLITDAVPVKYYTFAETNINGINLIMSRTGYTGEDGFEFYLNNNDSHKLFDMLLNVGKEFNILPCGLGARDTLRLEAGLPLYGHEIGKDIDPITAGLSFFVKFDKKTDFIGKDALKKISDAPLRKKIGLCAIDKGILRENAEIFDESNIKIGFTTSGTFCPFINKSAALAVADMRCNIGDIVYVDIRGRKIKSEIVQSNFYKREK